MSTVEDTEILTDKEILNKADEIFIRQVMDIFKPFAPIETDKYQKIKETRGKAQKIVRFK